MPSSISSSSAPFLWRVGVTAGAILLGYNLLLTVVRPQATPSSDAGMRNRVVAERYFDGSTPPAVLVGSSIAFRLSSDFLQAELLGPSVFDLALAGGSAASGLDILARKGALPRIVFVEMNVGNRAIDPVLLQELVAEPRLTLRRIFPALRLENRPVDLIVASGWAGLRKLIVGEPATTRPDINAASEPEVPNFAGRLAVTLAQNAGISEPLAKGLASGFEATGRLIDGLRAAGVRIVLLQFPMDAAVAASPSQRSSLEQARARFPLDRYEWFTIPDAESYRTDDGTHLTRPSGRRLAALLRRFVDEHLR